MLAITKAMLMVTVKTVKKMIRITFKDDGEGDDEDADQDDDDD